MPYVGSGLSKEADQLAVSSTHKVAHRIIQEILLLCVRWRVLWDLNGFLGTVVSLLRVLIRGWTSVDNRWSTYGLVVLG